MKVLLAPYSENHYQLSLKQAFDNSEIFLFPAIESSFLPILRSYFLYKVDIIHFHWLGTYIIGRNIIVSAFKFLLFLFELTACKILGVKFLWTVHNLYNHEKYQYKTEIFFNKILFRIIKNVIVHSYGQKKYLKSFYSLGPDIEIDVAYEGNYKKFYSPLLNQSEVRWKLRIDEKKKVFLFFGNIRGYKGVDILISAFKRVSKDNLLLIAGKPYDSNIKESIEIQIKNEENIIFFPGFASKEETALYFSACDAVVLPYSDIFNSGLAILTISYGKAAIYSDIEFLEEILKDGGYPFKTGDVSSLSEIIAKSDRNKMIEYGINNLKKSDIYTWENHCNILKGVYEKLLGK